MATIEPFERYVSELRKTPLDQQTEHTSRAPLEALLNHFKPRTACIIHEPKRAQAKGAPDFKVEQAAQVQGYVEVKAVGENLDQVLKSDQIKKYKTLSGNIILTDYLRFIWLRDGNPIADARLAEATALEGKPHPLRPERASEVEALLKNFFLQAPQGITRAKALAEALAVRSQLLRDYLGEELVRQQATRSGGQLIGLYGAFQKQVSHELTLAEFADAFAQTLAYGLFLARLNEKGDTKLTLLNAKNYVPGSVGLIRELVGFLDQLDRAEYSDVRWVVEEILSLINGLHVAALQEDLSFRNRKGRRGSRATSDEEWRLFSRDPFIYFYEDYLRKYDSKTSKARGVYYTPPPIVNFIVRAIHDILKTTFGIEAGLADSKRVTVLDFACGTGTFLVEVLERIFEEIGAGSGKSDRIVSEHILKNIYGFEYLIAPYTIAHLKLGQYLAERGHEMKEDERFQVYLTNTLEPIEPQANFLLPELSHETDHAQEIKNKPILVITGNPPYSGHSKNNGRVAKGRIDKYKQVWETGADGKEVQKPLGEKNPKWLQDDYVKFIAFAQEKMDAVEEGVVGIITNHSFLENPTFRGMRQSLMRSFDQIHVIDLHGNAKKKEVAQDGSKDENVFDIEQGVAISLLIKKKGVRRGVWRGDVWGKRQEKYEWGAGTQFTSLELINPQSPLYLFLQRDNQAAAAFEAHWSVTAIFPTNSVGIATARDALTIHFDPESLRQTVRDFVVLPVEEARKKYKLGKDARDWKVSLAQEDAAANLPGDHYQQGILYRPFDVRFTLFSGKSRGFQCMPRPEVMHHMRQPNIGLITSRLTKGETFSHAQVTDTISEVICMSPKTSNNGFLFPLYLYPPVEGARKAKADLFGGVDRFAGRARIENVAPAFRRWIDARYEHAFAPEQILGCIYAILHAPAYRTEYADFLRADFPRILFPERRADFEALSALGWALVQAHLLKAVPRHGLGGYRGRGEDVVEKPRYSEVEQTVWINAGKGFAKVSPEVWNFTIGGYQVIEKYLKSRKGRTLTLAEIENVENVVNVLAFTIDQMAKIDDAYRAAF